MKTLVSITVALLATLFTAALVSIHYHSIPTPTPALTLAAPASHAPLTGWVVGPACNLQGVAGVQIRPGYWNAWYTQGQPIQLYSGLTTAQMNRVWAWTKSKHHPLPPFPSTDLQVLPTR